MAPTTDDLLARVYLTPDVLAMGERAVDEVVKRIERDRAAREQEFARAAAREEVAKKAAAPRTTARKRRDPHDEVIRAQANRIARLESELAVARRTMTIDVRPVLNVVE